MRHTAIAFSDWEAVRLSFRVWRRNCKDRKERKDRKDHGGRLPERPILEEEIASASGTAGEIPAADFAKSWPGQMLVFDQDVIRAKGYVRSAQTVLSGVKGYTFYKADGKGQFFRPEMLLVQKMAHKA